MAGDQRGEAVDLTRLSALTESPHDHHFYQAMRIIEAAFKDKPRLGTSKSPKQDPIRLGQEAELAFPPSTIAGFRPPSPGQPGEMTSRFFGLFGPNGPLPLHLTEYARDRQRNHRDPTMIAFADIFHHRMMCLLHRAWVSGEPAPSFDRVDDDPFARKIAAFCGTLGSGMGDRDAMPDVSKLHFAGLLAQAQRTEDGLLTILRSFFRAPVELESFVPTWLYLERNDTWQLGGLTGHLGRSTSAGERVRSRQSKFRLRVGPLGIDAYRRLLPGSESLRRMRAIVRNYLGDQFEWDVNLILRANEVPAMQLGRTGELGLTTWAGERDSALGDANDLYLQPDLQAA